MKVLFRLFQKAYRITSKYVSLIRFLVDGRKKEYLLLCTPTHGNLGDQAIALAEMKFLRKLGLSFFEVTAEQIDGKYNFYSRYSSSKQKILVHGGGFLGDIWPKEELRFRKIVEIFYSKKIIVLPQTISFDLENENCLSFFNESYNIYKSHNNLIFFLRDENSVSFVKENMPELHCYYVPDIVLTFTKKSKLNSRNENIIFFKRHDIEQRLTVTDEKLLLDEINKYFPQSKLIYSDTCLQRAIFPFQRKKFVEKKLFEISSYKMAITDRLHGMIFAYLTDTPCLVLNNQNGKVKAVYKWLQKCENIIYCDDINKIEVCISKIANVNNNNTFIEFDQNFELLKEELRK